MNSGYVGAPQWLVSGTNRSPGPYFAIIIISNNLARALILSRSIGENRALSHNSTNKLMTTDNKSDMKVAPEERNQNERGLSRRGTLAALTGLGVLGLSSTTASADTDHSHLGEKWSGATSPGLEVEIESGEALVGTTTSTGDAFDFGVVGRTHAGRGRALAGFADNDSGNSIALLGRNRSTEGTGIRAQCDAESGETRGLISQVSSPDGRGIIGRNNASSGGPAYGIYGLSHSTSGIGIFGFASAISGETRGVVGRTLSPDGYGLYTPDDAKVKGDIEVDGSVKTTDDWVVETGTDAFGNAACVIQGHPDNYVQRGDGSVISGGGGPNDEDDGRSNVVIGSWATIGGGVANTNGGWASTIGGGDDNTITGKEATISGGKDNTTRANGATVGGGIQNEINGNLGTINGGRSNEVHGRYATISGGCVNMIRIEDDDQESSEYATISGGRGNEISGKFATAGGGQFNTANEDGTTVSGGNGNVASGYASAVGGGDSNRASGSRSVVGGGIENDASGHGATVPGGRYNTADGDSSFAAGEYAAADHDNTFVWADGSDSRWEPFSSGDDPNGSGVTGPQTFHVKATNGVRFLNDAGTTYIPPGSTGWSTASTRAVKTNVSPVEPQSALDGVESMEVATWEYTTEDGSGAGTTHIGPMAEDFHEAFDVGDTDEHINSINADGVAFAAIQGLAQRLEEENEQLRDELTEKDDQIADLESRLATLEAHLGTATESAHADD